MNTERKKIFKPKPTFCGILAWSIVGVFLLPILAVSIIATVKLFTQIPVFSTTILAFLGGIVIYSFFHMYIYRPIAFYVLAHEFTHAIFAIVSGVKVKKIKVSSKGGYVEMTQSNFVIDLAPYFFPLYSLMLTATFFSLDAIYGLDRYWLLFFAFLGASLAFHYLSNWETLKIEQPDMKLTGKIFGIVFITILNILFLNLLLMFVFLKYVNLSTIFENYLYAFDIFRKIFAWKIDV